MRLRLTRYVPHVPHPPQIAFLTLDSLEAFYGGAAGGGKSDALLMAALQYVDQPGYSAILFRKTYADLALPGAIMARAREWLAPHKNVAWNDQRKTFTFPSGATIAFGYLQHDDDKLRYQGAEFQMIGFDELTQFTEASYLYLFSRLRRLEGSTVPLRMRSASNPGGVGHSWVKKRFVTERKPPAVFIPARLDDNPSLDQAEYVESLHNLPEVTRRQLLDGDWDVFQGAAYNVTEDHLVPALPDYPNTWGRYESMDHGVANPTAWLLILVDYDANLVVADEYYKPGLPDEHAAEVKARRADWWEAKDDDGWPVRHPAWGDPASLRESLPHRHPTLGEPATLQTEYQDHGIRLSPANNRRRAGFVRLAELLKPDPTRLFPLWHPRRGDTGAPRLFVVESRCRNLVDQLRAAPLATEETDPERGEAVDRRWEGAHGHAHAALRYGVMARPGASAEPEPLPDDPRAQVLVLRNRRRAATPAWRRAGGAGGLLNV
jgi:hypothetical protein